jgi:hypothetical protein
MEKEVSDRQAQSALADLFEVTTVLGDSDEELRKYLIALGIVPEGSIWT